MTNKKATIKVVVDGLGFAQKGGIVINGIGFSSGSRLSCEERPGDQGWFSLGLRWLQWSLTAASQHP